MQSHYLEGACVHRSAPRRFAAAFGTTEFGDLERVLLRRGNRASAKYWRRVLLPVIERYWDCDIHKYFRGDAAFAGPKLLRLLEKEGFRYAIRIKANAVL